AQLSKAPTEASRVPPGENATERMGPPAVSSRSGGRPVARSQTMIVPPLLAPEARDLLSELNARLRTGEGEPRRTLRSRPAHGSHKTMSLCSELVAARVRPSGEYARALTRRIGIPKSRSVPAVSRSNKRMPGSIPPTARNRPSGENDKALGIPR